MKKYVVLGPKGTYCDIALKNYLKNEKAMVEYYPSILKMPKYLANADYAILPFENTLDGFVIESMDQIIINNYHIYSQTKLKIDFAFISNAKDISSVKYVYCQFKAYGQCLDFISNNNFSTIITQSNTESFNSLIDKNEEYGAIVPMHLINDNSFNITIKHIADSKQNETRFFILSAYNEVEKLNTEVEASIVITAKTDRPGVLFEILKSFHELNINLKSIMSRPMKTVMGRYRFYFECSLFKDDVSVLEILKDMFKNSQDFILQILGVYNSLN